MGTRVVATHRAQKRTTQGTRRTLCHGPYVILLMNAPFEDKQRNCMTSFDFVHQNEQWTLVAVTVHMGQTQDRVRVVVHPLTPV